MQSPGVDPVIARTGPPPGREDRERPELVGRADNVRNQPPAATSARRADSAPAATPKTQEIGAAPATTPPQGATPPPKRAAAPAVPQHVAREAAKPHPPGVKRTAHREAGKRRAHAAADPLRRFGERPREDPMHAYAAGGMERKIVIHPRSIQDVYYYSLPR